MLVTRAGPLLSQVRLDQLRPLGRLGEPTYLAYGRVAAALEGMGAADCARYFARPEPDARGETLSWHAMPDGGPVRSWVSLSAEEQRAAAPRLLAITQRLSEIARGARRPIRTMAWRISCATPPCRPGWSISTWWATNRC
jgi:hypothetical protein